MSPGPEEVKYSLKNRAGRRSEVAMLRKKPYQDRVYKAKLKLENDKRIHRAKMQKRQDLAHERALKRKEGANKK